MNVDISPLRAVYGEAFVQRLAERFGAAGYSPNNPFVYFRTALLFGRVRRSTVEQLARRAEFWRSQIPPGAYLSAMASARSSGEYKSLQQRVKELFANCDPPRHEWDAFIFGPFYYGLDVESRRKFLDHVPARVRDYAVRGDSPSHVITVAGKLRLRAECMRGLDPDGAPVWAEHGWLINNPSYGVPYNTCGTLTSSYAFVAPDHARARGFVLYDCGWYATADEAAEAQRIDEESDEDDEYDDYDSDYDDDDDSNRRRRDVIHGYHSTGPHRTRKVCFHEPLATDRLRDDTLTLGMELELNSEDRERLAERMTVTGPAAYASIAEEDGSLDDERGVEIITGWSTLETVMSWAQAYGAAVLEAGDYDVENCGLHISTSKLPIEHVRRIMAFVYAVDNEFFVKALAGRGFGSYNEKPGALHTGDMECVHCDSARAVEIKARKAAMGGPQADRYQAINVRYQAPYESHGGRYASTIEWRMFKGSGNAVRIIARLQLVWALTKYTDPDRCQPLTVKGFLDGLVHDVFLRKHTQPLRAYIVGKIGARKLNELSPKFIPTTIADNDRRDKKRKLATMPAAPVKAKKRKLVPA